MSGIKYEIKTLKPEDFAPKANAVNQKTNAGKGKEMPSPQKSPNPKKKEK